MTGKQCEERGLTHVNDGSASREEMLAAIARHDKSRADEGGSGRRRLTAAAGAADDPDAGRAGKRPRGSGTGGGSSAGSTTRVRLDPDSLPSNLHTLSLSQLKAVCAAQGMVAKGSSCAAVIREIEEALYGGTEGATMLLE